MSGVLSCGRAFPTALSRLCALPIATCHGSRRLPAARPLGFNDSTGRCVTSFAQLPEGPAASTSGLLPSGRSGLSRSHRRTLSSSNSERQVAANFHTETHGRSSAPSTSSTRLRVAVDVDEVLGRFVYALNVFCKEKYGMHHDVKDYWIYEFAKIWNCSQDTSNHIVHEFFKSSHFNDGIPVIPGAYDTLGRLAKDCDLVVVTSRQHVIQDQTLDWLDTHYPDIFTEVYFGNHWSLEGTSRKKSDICRAIGATVLIDDNPSYALECAQAGIHVLLYDWDLAYPWSKLPVGSPAHPLITVVRNWAEAERTLQALTPQLLAKAH